MKHFFLIICVALSLSVVSCTTDTDELNDFSDNFIESGSYEHENNYTKTVKTRWLSLSLETYAQAKQSCQSYKMQLISFDTKEDKDQFISVFTPETKLDAWVGYTDEAQNAPLLKVENDNTNIFDANPTEEHLSYCESVVTTNILQPEVVNMELHYKKENALLISKLKLLEDENEIQKNQLKVCHNSSSQSSQDRYNEYEKQKYSEEMAQQKQHFNTEMLKLKNHIAKLENEHAGKDTSNVFADNNQLKIDLQYCNEQFSIITKENSFLKKLDTSTLNCDYEDDGQYYSCNSDDFEIINENSNIDVHGTHQVYKTESDVVEVNFVNCKTKRFSNAIFKHFSNLENLNIVNSSLNYLTQGVFNGAEHLKKLNIQGNNIRAIWYYVFEGAGALNVLKMENNNIESLSTEAFQGLNNLQTLSLRSNKIKELPVSIFVDLNKIRYLVFSSNQLQELDAKLFENNKEIRELWFDKNNLTKVDSEIFSYSPYIKRAVFTDNNCINIDSDDVCQEMFKSQVDGNC